MGSDLVLISFWTSFLPPHFVAHLPLCLLVLILLYHSSTSWCMLNLDNEQQHVHKYDKHQNLSRFLESPHLVLISFCRRNQHLLEPCLTPHNVFIKVNKRSCSYTFVYYVSPTKLIMLPSSSTSPFANAAAMPPSDAQSRKYPKMKGNP